MLPGRHTPCYECAFIHRQHAPDVQAARGSRLNIQQVVLATAQVVRALLDPDDEGAAILEPETRSMASRRATLSTYMD